MTTDELLPSEAYREQLELLAETIDSVREPLLSETTLTTDQQTIVRRLLLVTSRSITETRRLLIDLGGSLDKTVVHTTGIGDHEELPNQWDDPEEAFEYLERCLDRMLCETRQDEAEGDFVCSSLADKLETILGNLMLLRETHPALSTESRLKSDITETNLNSEQQIDGRGRGDGRWLEHQLQRALFRWGYRTDTRQTLFGLEIDVVASRKEKQHEPTDWIVAQCKDWDTAPITPTTLFRLCTVAFACRAMPVLCHTTELTSRTAELARRFEVRVLELDDLQRAELPAPTVAKPTTNIYGEEISYRARDDRGSLPSMFRMEPSKHFSYVPGFVPVGRNADYEPIEKDLDEDTHPAEGH